jgi:hypothetical protein
MAFSDVTTYSNAVDTSVSEVHAAFIFRVMWHGSFYTIGILATFWGSFSLHHTQFQAPQSKV